MSNSDCEKKLVKAIKNFLSKKHTVKIQEKEKDIVNEEPATNIIAAYLNKMCKDKIFITEFPMKILAGNKEWKRSKVDLACLSVSDSKLKWVAEAKPIPFGGGKKFHKDDQMLDSCIKMSKEKIKKRKNIQSDIDKLYKLSHEKQIPCYYIMYVKRYRDNSKDKLRIEPFKNPKETIKFGKLTLKLVKNGLIPKEWLRNENEFQAALLWRVKGNSKK